MASQSIVRQVANQGPFYFVSFLLTQTQNRWIESNDNHYSAQLPNKLPSTYHADINLETVVEIFKKLEMKIEFDNENIYLYASEPKNMKKTLQDLENIANSNHISNTSHSRLSIPNLDEITKRMEERKGNDMRY